MMKRKINRGGRWSKEEISREGERKKRKIKREREILGRDEGMKEIRKEQRKKGKRERYKGKLRDHW